MLVKNSETKSNRGKVAAVGLLAALGAFASVPASALPVATTIARPANELPVENVGCRNCAAVGVGVAAGVIAGAAIAGAANNNRRQQNYYYEEPEVVYAPRAYAPAPRYGKCWVQQGPYRGEGYWARC